VPNVASGERLRQLAPGRVLVVDDQLENVELLEEILCEEGYVVSRAMDGEEALEAVRKAPPDLVVLDIMMPRLDGFAVCERLKKSRRTCFIPIVMLTALSDIADKVRGLNLGADDFLNKPVNQGELIGRVKSLIRIKRLREELDSSENIIHSMAYALDGKDPKSVGHCQKIAANAVALARRLSLPPGELETIARGALLHDVGKIGVPDGLLARDRVLDGDELSEYRKHAAFGEQILGPLISFSGVREIIRHHHERLDGSGYPDGLSGSELTLGAEIVAVANHYEDLVLLLGQPAAASQALRSQAIAGAFHVQIVEEFLALPPVEAAPESWDELLPPVETAPSGKILIADPGGRTRTLLEDVLQNAGNRVSFVDSAEALLEAVAVSPPDLVLIGLPDSWAACETLRSREKTGFLPLVIMTDFEGAKDKARAAKAGADDVLMLPVNRVELISRVRSLLRLRLHFRDLEEHQSVVLSLATALEAKDPYTRGHSERVGVLSARLAREMGMTEEQCELMKVAGLLHDIGKIGVPEHLLNKKGALTEEEFQSILTHPRRGELICRPVRSLQTVLPYIRHHHERYDGRGYPDRLKGDAIPIGARVLAMADAFDALTSDRSYRKRLPSEEALTILARETETGHWDPLVFASLAGMVRRELG